MKLDFEIIRGLTEHASALTEITVAAKRHWGYPEKWIQLWLPTLTITSEYIATHETWVAIVNEKPVAYYSLISVTPALARGASVASHEVAKQSPTLISGLLRREEHPPRNDVDSLWLDNLWVFPEYIGKGLGKKLFAHALERCRARGASILLIQADPNAQSFYEKMGAHKVGEQHSEIDGQLRILPVMELNCDLTN